jgi:hypothetical protein
MYKKFTLSMLALFCMSLMQGQDSAAVSSQEHHIILPAEQITADNTEIHFDLDGVIIDKSSKFWMQMNIIKLAFTKDWTKCFSYIAALRRMNGRSHKDIHGNKLFYDNDGQEIHGATLAMIQNALTEPILQNYVPDILDIVARSHVFTKGAHQLLVILKDKGYTVKFATNKDRISYDDTARAMSDKKAPLSVHADQVFSLYPENTRLVSDMRDYLKVHGSETDKFTQLIRRTLAVQETDTFVHMARPKPEQPYIVKQREYAHKKYVFFFDNHQENTKAVTQYGHGMVGVYVTTVAEIAEHVYALGILSRTEYESIMHAVNG